MRRSFVLALVTPLALAALALAEDLKDQATLEAQWKSLGWQIAEKHTDLASTLEKADSKREAVEELALAVLVDPEHKRAREKLGFKKDGNVWRGYPEVPPPSRSALLDERLAKLREKAHAESATRISAFAKRAKAVFPDDARRLAGIACDFVWNERTAREITGGQERDGAWVSVREVRIADAFLKSMANASEGDTGKDDDRDKELAKLLDLGDLARRASPHVTLLVAKGAPSPDVSRAAKAAEAAWASFHYFVMGETDGFSIEGEPRRELTGVRAPTARPRLLYVSDSEHDRFCEKMFADKGAREFHKKLGGLYTVARVTSASLGVFESRMEPTLRCEEAAADVVSWHALDAVPKKATFPPFLLEGLHRFFAGHISGRADICWVSGGGTGGRAPFVPGPFDRFRGRVRPVFLVTFAGELRSLFARSVNELDFEDSVRAFAFVDFLLARHRSELAVYLSSLKPEEAAEKTFERALKRDLDDLERELKEWVREEY